MATVIPSAFAALREFPQFILWKQVLEPGDTKPRKVPCSSLGFDIKAHDPTVWMSAAAAEAAAAQTGFHIGFVFSDNDPFFFLDIDNALQGGEWSPLAIELFQGFPGAAFEVSISGTGGHIVARGTPAPEFKTKAQQHGLELYSTLRFMAFGTGHSQGDANTDHSQTILDAQRRFFEPRIGEGETPAEWTGKHPECTAPDDDDELISIILRAGARDPAAMFGNKLLPKDLWEKNEEKLGAHFPHPDKIFDHSSADQALMNHLAFYTGMDCNRMIRLFKRSQLMRPKFEKADYCRRTILKAVQGRKTFYDVPRKTTVADASKNTVDSGVTLLPHDQIKFFEDFVYISDRDEVLTSRGLFLGHSAFRNTYSNRKFVYTADGTDTKDAWIAFTQNQCVDFPKCDRTAFRPDLPVRARLDLENGQTAVNVFDPRELGAFVTPASDADVAPFLDHIARMLPVVRDRQILISFMAACIQFRGRKFDWAPFVQGSQGNGKSTLLRIMEFCQGKGLSHWVKSAELGDSSQRFNAWLENKLIYLVDEIYAKDRTDIMNSLKPLITAKRVEIQAKGRDQITRDVCGNFILVSNDKDAISIRRDDRRFAPFFTAQQEPGDPQLYGMTNAYFEGLNHWLDNGGFELIHGWLKIFPILDEFNPMKHSRAPITSSTEDAYSRSRSFPEQLIMEAVEEQQIGTRGGWLTMKSAERILQKARIKSPDFIERIVLELGFVRHPLMSNGRPDKEIPGEGRPRMWCLKDSDAFRSPSPRDHYIATQGLSTVGASVAA